MNSWCIAALPSWKVGIESALSEFVALKGLHTHDCTTNGLRVNLITTHRLFCLQRQLSQLYPPPPRHINVPSSSLIYSLIWNNTDFLLKAINRSDRTKCSKPKYNFMSCNNRSWRKDMTSLVGHTAMQVCWKSSDVLAEINHTLKPEVACSP